MSYLIRSTCTSACLIALAVLIFGFHANAATLAGRVAHVVDGDTLDVMVQDKRVRIRILDIDAPEHAQPYGHRFRQSLIAICGGESAQLDGHKQRQERPPAGTTFAVMEPTLALSKCGEEWPGCSCATRRPIRRCML